MSPEALLLLAFFILLPLIERMLRSLRQPDGGAADVQRPAPRPSIPQLPPPMDARVRSTTKPEPLLARRAARRSPPLQVAAPHTRRAPRRGPVTHDFNHPLALRRAVVLMTILGPCRSVAPHEWTGPSGSAGRS